MNSLFLRGRVPEENWYPWLSHEEPVYHHLSVLVFTWCVLPGSAALNIGYTCGLNDAGNPENSPLGAQYPPLSRDPELEVKWLLGLR